MRLTNSECHVIDRIAAILAKTCDPKTVADILNGTLTADADPNLNDMESRYAARLFDRLSELAPDAVEVAKLSA
jgi:hypothetical protein